MTKTQRGGSQYHGVSFIEGLAADGTSHTTPIWAASVGQGSTFTRTGEIADTRRGNGLMGGHVVFHQEDTIELTFKCLANDDSIRDAAGFGAEGEAATDLVQAGNLINIVTGPTHYQGKWMITEVGDTHSNEDVAEFTVSCRRAAGVDYDNTGAVPGP